MTVTKHPTREELACLICGASDVAFDHIKERSTHPQLKKEPTNIAPLCPGHHLAKTNKVMETEVWSDCMDSHAMLCYHWRLRGNDAPWMHVPVNVNKRHKCLEPDSAAEEQAQDSRDLGADGAASSPAAPSGSEGPGPQEVAWKRAIDDVRKTQDYSSPFGSGSPAVEQQQNSERPVGNIGGDSTAEPPVPVESAAEEVPRSSKAERQPEGLEHVGSNPTGDKASSAAPPAGTDASSSPPRPAQAPAGYESWVKDIKGIAMIGRLWQFDLGDKALEGERLWPHESSDALSKLGIHPGTLVNIMRVAERVPSSLRRGELRWSQHVLVAGLDRETIESVLDRAVTEEWGVGQTRDFLRAEGHLPAPKPRVKQYKLEEMAALWQEWQHEGFRDHEENCESCLTFTEFRDWLEGQT